MTQDRTQAQDAERLEREEMFGFHPDILTDAPAPPRKIRGRSDEAPEAPEDRAELDGSP